MELSFKRDALMVVHSGSCRRSFRHQQRVECQHSTQTAAHLEGAWRAGREISRPAVGTSDCWFFGEYYGNPNMLGTYYR